MYRRQSRTATFTAWILSLLINVLLLCLLSLLPQRLRFPPEMGLQVDMISVPAQPEPKPRVAARPTVTRSSRPINTPSPQTPPPSAVPLTTHLRNIPQAPDETTLTVPDETALVDEMKLPVDLGRNSPIQTGGFTRGVDYSRSPRPSVDAPQRAKNWLKALREEAGEAPQAQVSRAGGEISGYYNIATVQYEDTADAMRTQALSHLVMGMNRWTNVRTQLLPGSTPLADPEIQRIPLVYIAAQDPFAFSEEERANLQAYLQNGGTLLFSDISPEWGVRGPVANSIRFELWKILGEDADLRPIEREDAVCTSFFEFKKGVPLKDKDRSEFYAFRLNGRIAVFYDAAGLGLKWAEDEGDEKWLRWGVNLIVYTLVSAR